jgi:hypothetical protein
MTEALPSGRPRSDGKAKTARRPPEKTNSTETWAATASEKKTTDVGDDALSRAGWTMPARIRRTGGPRVNQARTGADQIRTQQSMEATAPTLTPKDSQPPHLTKPPTTSHTLPHDTKQHQTKRKGYETSSSPNQQTHLRKVEGHRHTETTTTGLGLVNGGRR